MKPTSTDRELRERIDAFVVEISNLVRISALEAVHAALGSTLGASPAPAAKRGPGRPPKAASAAKSSGGKRSPEAVLKTADAVLAYIKAHPGQRLEEIGKGVKMPTKELKLPIQKLFDAKSISTKGVKRGTKYFVR
ncbi:MAG: DNA-binding protein [Planctomycetes bacterium]|nr:DNA-binding protein [Planctomycetota bacterium]